MLVVGITCNRWCKDQSDFILGLRWYAMAATLEMWSREKIVVWFNLYCWEFSPLWIALPLCKGVCWWCNESAVCLRVHDDADNENDDDDDCGVGWPSTLRTGVNSAWVEELTVENWWDTKQSRVFHNSKEVEWLHLNVCEHKSPFSSVVELWTHARIRQMHLNCTLELCWKMVILQCNIRATLNVVMTSLLTPMT